MTLPLLTWYSHTYRLDTPNVNRNSSSHDLCVTAWLASGERGAGVPRRWLGHVAKRTATKLRRLLLVPTLESYKVRDRHGAILIYCRLRARARWRRHAGLTTS